MSITLYSSPMKYKDPTTGNYVDLVGISGNPGRGIASVVLNNDYTLTITFTDNTSTTVGPIRGEPGEDYVLTEQDKEDIAALVDAPVQDVQVNGTSILGQDGVANVPIADATNPGVMQVGTGASGVTISNNELQIARAGITHIKAGSSAYRPIVPYEQHNAAFYGLAKAAGADMASSSNSVGTYTPEAKGSIQQMLGVSDLLAPSEPTLIASKTYSVGDVFTANGKLYKVTSAIAAAETIVVQNEGETVSGHNAEECKVADYAVHDVQVNGTSIVQDGVANVPQASANSFGVVRVSGQSYGISMLADTERNGVLRTYGASEATIKAGADAYQPIVSNKVNAATFYGLAKAAGDSSQSASSNAVGTYTDTAKSAIQHMLGTDINLGPYESDTTADAAYAVGELFMLNGKLHRATSAIAIGDTLTVGTNCEVVNASEVFPHDVQINGTSILSNGVANIPRASLAAWGATTMSTSGYIKGGSNANYSICPWLQHEAVFYGLAKAAGADMASISSTTVGVYPEAQKSAIHEMLNGSVAVTGTTPTITALPGIRYVCGEAATLDITLPASGIVDVVFSSGSTATVLTITPPTGVTVKWAGGFDPTALDANTTYEINIADGLGVAVGWT